VPFFFLQCDPASECQLATILCSHPVARKRITVIGRVSARLTNEEIAMPKYVIERDIPGAGTLTPSELQDISRKSCAVLEEMGPQTQWVQSYVTGDKIYCVYIAPNEAAVREHAQRGGFPANRISQVTTTIDPTTAE
jgi:hypothetical protein